MPQDETNQYDLDPHVAEMYDLFETGTDDVELIRGFIGAREGLKILEPFCGTGRILVPLARDGHHIVGIDQSEAMLERARARVGGLPRDVQERITVVLADVLDTQWPGGFDLVVLGGNCFYELSSPEEQESCVASAAASLNPGGHVYIDNNHVEGELDESWWQPGVRKTVFPSGVCADGTRLEGTTETLWFDAARRLSRCRRIITLTRPDGAAETMEYVQQKHPPSAAEVAGWLERYGFVIEETRGDRAGNPYHDTSPRAIFWAAKRT